MTDTARARRSRERAGVCLVLFCLTALTGCRSTFWRAPGFACPRHRVAVPFTSLPSGPFDLAKGSVSAEQGAVVDCLARVERSYALGWQLEGEDRAECVDQYYQAAVACWPILEQGIGQTDRTDEFDRAWELYHSSLAKLISTGQSVGRLDPRRGLTVFGPSGPSRIGVRHVGSPWASEDFAQLILVGDYSHPKLTNAYRRGGLGVPVVVRSADKDRNQFLHPHQVFSATAVLRPSSGVSLGTSSPVALGCATLELIDPLRISSVPVGGGPFPLASDLSAPIAYRLVPRDRRPVREFLQPGASTSEERLYMIEPYQPGKIPLVFVHGLLSDPLTWAGLANELLVRPDIVAKYQMWAFEYPTGQAFLSSAAALREKLQTIRHQLDPWHQDGALDQMVLVGHSMGGLVCELQVTASGSVLWDAIASRPLDQIRTNQQTRRELARLFFFQPVSSVKRVIFVGTPHRGSAWAQRSIGRLGSLLVTEPTELRRQRLQLIEDNPDIFAPQFRRRIPTSVDLLEPSDRLLQAMESLPFACDVHIHSIIGTGCWTIGSGSSDGVVAVSSARHAGESEKLVHSRHRGLQQNPDSVTEVIRILRLHALPVAAVPTQAASPVQAVAR